MGLRRVGHPLTWGREAAVVVVVVALATAVGFLSAGNADVAAAVALGVLGLGLAVAAPYALIALTLPATLLMARVGGVLSVSDVVLAGTAVLTLLVLPARRMIPLRPLLWGGVAYLAAALPTLVLNPYSANVVEWVHEVALVLGSMIVGFAIGRAGQARLAVGGYVVACLGIAITTVVVGTVEKTLGDTYITFLALHKNYIGGALAVAIVLVYGRPSWFRWWRSWTWPAILVLAAGVLASGSRQGMAAAVVGVLVVSLRPDPDTGKVRILPWLIAAPATIAIFTLVRGQLETGDSFNSAYQRLDWYAQSIAIWLDSPVFGVGLRWWYTDRYGQFQPPNAELEVLSSVGAVGLIGFLAMFLVGFVVLWRIDPRYGTVAAAVIAARFTQAQFDLYWVAGQASLLWIVAGIAIGAQERDRTGDRAAVDALAARLEGRGSVGGAARRMGIVVPPR